MKLNEEIDIYKIYPNYEVFYIECIKTASLNAIESWEKLNAIVSDGNIFESKGMETVDLSENIVNQAGIISKFFFPPRIEGAKNKIHRLRGEKLKESYKIKDNNVLKDRDFRNFIEHFDEKLDDFLNENIIPLKNIFINSDHIKEVTFVFKAYIVNEFTFISLNEKIHITPLIEEIYRIHNHCIDFLDNGGRL